MTLTIAKISFKQYMTSKLKLTEAIKSDPIVDINYIVVKYCKLSYGVNKSQRQYLHFKPNARIIIKWRITNHTLVTSKSDFSSLEKNPLGIITSDRLDMFELYQTDDKIIKWLTINCKEG